ncbi:phosphoribosylanthranilate isomerase [Metabacillus arenae]|uniref:N-(5'-phosphoribosyl)anthranilate isomerase n=1 Tax=Metabacillus arenae TaxID=2771434 RepID=A0A926RVM5_9BACI|nr:phosphoribosylanthranilate isomerase [Metabacillus arenae]MBD1378605.1 phosphoribosylanthranilate isomerase [Metabacillus arenae]
MQKPLLKLCGNRSYEDFLLTSQSPADYLGFIFAKGKRQVQPQEVKEWIGRHIPFSQKIVGVFVNPTNEEIAEVLNAVPLDVIQLHGNESIERVEELTAAFDSCFWKALHHQADTVSKMSAYAPFVDGYIIDTLIKGEWGGTGETFDWMSVPSYKKMAQKLNKICFIAGGIDADNVSNLLDLHPAGVDLSSGIEQNEKKDSAKLQLLIERMNKHVSIS